MVSLELYAIVYPFPSVINYRLILVDAVIPQSRPDAQPCICNLQGASKLQSLVELGPGVHIFAEADASCIYCNVGLHIYVSCSSTEANHVCQTHKARLQALIGDSTQQLAQLDLLSMLAQREAA